MFPASRSKRCTAHRHERVGDRDGNGGGDGDGRLDKSVLMLKHENSDILKQMESSKIH